MLSPKEITRLIRSITEKRELQGISPDFVQKELFAFLRSNPRVLFSLSRSFHRKSLGYKQAVKGVRERLRKIYGLFRKGGSRPRIKLLMEKMKHSPLSEQGKVLRMILEASASTKERLPFYPQLYSKLFTLTGVPRTLLDLGCGINPFSLFFMKFKNLHYYAYDLDQEEISLLNEFFSFVRRNNLSFKGEAEVSNILRPGKLRRLPPADLCFLFKTTDALDRGKSHKTSEEVIKAVPARSVVVSFSTKTMSGKPMTAPRRRWMEWMCRRLGYPFSVIEFSNEIFYIIKKVNSSPALPLPGRKYFSNLQK